MSTTHRAFSPPETSSFRKTLTSVATIRTSAASLPPSRARRPRLVSAAVQVLAPVEEKLVDGGRADDLALREREADRVE